MTARPLKARVIDAMRWLDEVSPVELFGAPQVTDIAEMINMPHFLVGNTMAELERMGIVKQTRIAGERRLTRPWRRANDNQRREALS